ncbi:glycosyltransferase family 4 protein [Paenibacillus sp. MBLB4367]|uniref:glycosyltransferase family 4 protein n=1 Tax=Paenibacillus sp. MBLB4367 TaxID=3384767 RepID=UPI0039083A54
MRTIRILMLVYRLDLGGTENYMINLARALRPLGVQVGIATSGGPLVGRCRRQGIPVHLIPGFTSVTAAATAARLSRLVASRGYQIVHANDTYSFSVAAALYRRRKIPVVMTLHGRFHGLPPVRKAAGIARRIIAVTPNLSAWVRTLGLPAHKCVRIPVGIRTDVFRPRDKTACRRKLGLPLSGRLLAYASRFGVDKYPIARKVIQASERIAKISPKFTAVLAGPGIYRKRLSGLAAAANRRIGRRAIIVRPPIMDIWHLYGAANAVVGTGTVANEAMACGKPLIAAGTQSYFGIVRKSNAAAAMWNQFGDHGGKRQVTAAQMARDIKRVLNAPAWSASLGRKGRNMTVRRFSVRNVALRIRDVYRSCLR